MLKFLPKILLANLAIFVTFLTLSTLAFAQGEAYDPIESSELLEPTLEETVRSLSIIAVVIGTVLIVIFVFLTILLKNQSEALKKILFIGITLPTLATTIFLVGSTLTLNVLSETKGPVHWHADFEIWDCGQELDLINPQGFSNKVGTPSLHEHNDNRIHVEGTVVNEQDVSLKSFFRVVGGDLSADEMRVPVDGQGLIVRRNDDLCAGGEPGIMQVFLYKIEKAHHSQKSNFVYEQTKLDNPDLYVLSPFATVPPGDCIIIEFDTLEKEKTDKICESYEVQKLKGELYGD